MTQSLIATKYRVPDFIIIGAMKSGTTTLYEWLSRHPGVGFAGKEIEFFCRDQAWNRGVESYSSLFGSITGSKIAGEASPNYTHPSYAAIAAERMAKTVPEARLIYIVRHPLERLRSHYRHEVQRGRERRRFLEALREDPERYAGLSRYYTCLVPFIARFSRDQILVLRMEDLVADSGESWCQVLRHLGLDPIERPTTAHNVTAKKRQYSRLMLWLWERNWLKHVSLVPRPLRRLGKLILTREGDVYQRQLNESKEPVPAHLCASIWEDIRQLEDWMNVDHPLWIDPSVKQLV